MADGDLHSVEKLVRESVFHPSPCRRLRERVVHNAVQATHRQTLSRRAVIASAFAVGLIVSPLIVVQYVLSKSPVTDPPRPAVVHDPGSLGAPASLSTQPNRNQQTSPMSYGEARYYGGVNVHQVNSQVEP